MADRFCVERRRRSGADLPRSRGLRSSSKPSPAPSPGRPFTSSLCLDTQLQVLTRAARTRLKSRVMLEDGHWSLAISRSSADPELSKKRWPDAFRISSRQPITIE